MNHFHFSQQKQFKQQYKIIEQVLSFVSVKESMFTLVLSIETFALLGKAKMGAQILVFPWKGNKYINTYMHISTAGKVIQQIINQLKVRKSLGERKLFTFYTNLICDSAYVSPGVRTTCTNNTEHGVSGKQ